ncbi:MAG TPA: TatD family hydrolase [Geminicoccaceae bacterium]|nr:TatD family hydrolase [Geminicoccaceae bacterium]
MLVDSHCHLDFPGLAEERDAVLARARAAGVGLMQTIGTRLETFAQVLAIAEANPEVYCSVGVHPHRAAKEPLDGPARLLEWAGHPRVIGIGESGLDYYYDNSPRDVQAAMFRVHIQAARVSGLPLIVHTREADRDTIDMLRAAMAEGSFAGVIHCYSSSPELGFAAVDMGLYLGIGGILTFKRSDQLRATVRELPLERLLLETDAPYLAPEPFRGKRNEPAYVAYVAAKLAEIKGLEVAEIEAATTDNFFRLFTKAKRPADVPCA